MLQLAWPFALALLPLPWLVRRLLPSADESAMGTVFMPRAEPLTAGETRKQQTRSRHLPLLMLWILWLLFLAALTRPQWLGDAIEIPETGRSLMLALDVSGSMETPDLDQNQSQRSRLSVVKDIASDFIEKRQGDRIGLILFGSQAYLQTPLTFDRQTTQQYLSEAMIGIAGRETAIGDAIGLAVKRLRDTPNEKAVLILMTDGANTAGSISPKQAADLAAQTAIKIYTIGVGANQMRVQGFFGPETVNPSSDLDEETLTYIAETTGGRYFRATNVDALRRIYALLDKLEPVTSGSTTVRPVSELYFWPLGIAWGTTLIWAFVALHINRRVKPHESR